MKTGHHPAEAFALILATALFAFTPGLPAQNSQDANPPGQQQQMVGGANSAAPAINPATGQPDYSAQWCEYYRSMGMHEQANMIEAQMKQQQAAQQGARPQQAYYSS